MTIKKIDRKACVSQCGICMDSCPCDVIRLDQEGKAYIAYLEDCHTCFLCEDDCPAKAVTVSAEVLGTPLPY